MEDLTSKIRSAHIDLNRYLPSLVQLHTFDGHVYGLPKDWDTIAYFYNIDYFQQHNITIPSNLTWDPVTGGTWLTFLRSITYDTSGRSAWRRTSTRTRWPRTAPRRPTRCSGASSPSWPRMA